MVKYGIVSVGLLVEPEASPPESAGGNSGSGASPNNKPLRLGFEYRPDMADLIIKLCDDQDNDSSNDESDHPESDKSGGSGKSSRSSQRSVRVIRTLERVDPEVCESVLANSTTRNRPACRKSRSESQIFPGSTNNRAYAVINNNNSDNNNSGKKPCAFYRQKFLEESLHHSEYSDWLNFQTIQKNAGQKVVRKLAAQQKALEAEAEQQRKKVMMQSGNGSGKGSGSGSSSSSASSGSEVENNNNNNNSGNRSPKNNFIPPKKKPGRLDPMALTAIKLSD